MEIYVLASGSKGNMTYLKTHQANIFIDAGIGITKIKEKMNTYNLDLSIVDTLFLTHEHADHIAGLKGLLKLKTIKNVYLTEGTFNALSDDVKDLLPKCIIIKADQCFIYKDLTVSTMLLSHDASEPIGFTIVNDLGKKVVFLTDTGYVDYTYDNLLADADLYILEANHNPNTLIKSSRPFYLKQRIIGPKGHLSNQDAAILMNRLVKNKTAIWVIAHISEDCNCPLDIERAIVEHFDDPTKVTCFYASQSSLARICL